MDKTGMYLDQTAQQYGYELYALGYTEGHIYKAEFVKKNIENPLFKLFIEFEDRDHDKINIGCIRMDETECDRITYKELLMLRDIINTIIHTNEYWFMPEEYSKKDK